jgi:hypothetical protein
LDQEVFAIYKSLLDKLAISIAQESRLAGENLVSSEIMSMASHLATEVALKENNIKAAFKASFIWPWDPQGLLDAARGNIGQSPRRAIEKPQDSIAQVREAAKRGAAEYLSASRRKHEERKKNFIKVTVTADYPQSISAEGLIQLSRSRRAEKEAEEAAAEAKREAKAAKKREREQITCKVPGCSTYEHSSKDRKRNPFRWCDYCYEFGICGSHFAETENAALLEHHERICPSRPTTSSRGRKAARKE